MGLSEIWLANSDELITKKINQIVNLAGDGILRDDSSTSSEIKNYIRIIPSELLISYIKQCLDNHFENSGFVLQDLLNETGRRLDFLIENGRYRGISGKIGYDGLWTSNSGKKIIVEVKTTDTYRIDLNVLAEYRKKLAAERSILEDSVSILIVVGRQDTGDLESQVRGSRFAWDIRIISIDSVLKLLEIKERLEDPKATERIHQILMPKEYTKLDGIVDLVFSATEDAILIKDIEEDLSDDKDDKTEEYKVGKKFTPVAYRELCVIRYKKLFNKNLIKKSYALYETEDIKTGVLFLTSREYTKNNKIGYWFAFHPHQKEHLDRYSNKDVIFALGSEKLMVKIPYDIFTINIIKCNKTVLEDRFYWHIHIHKKENKYFWIMKKEFEDIDITEYIIG